MWFIWNFTDANPYAFEHIAFINCICEMYVCVCDDMYKYWYCMWQWIWKCDYFYLKLNVNNNILENENIIQLQYKY